MCLVLEHNIYFELFVQSSLKREKKAEDIHCTVKVFGVILYVQNIVAVGEKSRISTFVVFHLMYFESIG